MLDEGADLSAVVVLRRELNASGVSDAHIRVKLARGELHRVRHGAYVDGSFWRSLCARDRHRVLVRAVLLTAHPSAVASHVSAAIEHGGDTWGADLDVVHLTRLDGRIGRREAGVVQHRGRLARDEVVTVAGIPVTNQARCAVEVISVLEAEPALVTVNSLLHLGTLDHAELVEVNRNLKHWPSTLQAAVVLRLCDDRIESVGETRTSYLCHQQGLPRPVPQVVIKDERGWVIGRVDFAWPEAGVFLEFQGREKYLRYRRENESLDDYLLREKRRIELICQITGWVCIPITWADLERPLVTAARIRRLLASRQSTGA